MEKSSQSKRVSSVASIVLWAMVAVLAVVGLLLPPVSLGKRLVTRKGLLELSVDSSRVSHPDGLALAVDPALLVEPVRVRLDSVARLEFLGQAVPDEWQTAAAALPSFLTLKSPVYGISFADENDLPVHLEIAIPNDAQPYRLLDLYSWDGAAWQWMPSRLDVAADVIAADLERAPQAVAVVQAGAQELLVGMSVGHGDGLPPASSDVASELYSAGLVLGPGGALLGQVVSFDGDSSTFRQFPTSVSADPLLVQSLLSDPGAQQVHIRALASLAVGGGYAGLNLDYQGIAAGQREAFTAFVAELADGLRAADLELVVTVPAPYPGQASSSGWDTAGYDWPALAAAADRLIVTLPLEPAAYSPDGPVDQLLTWAVSQVNRRQLLIGLSGGAVREVGGVFSVTSTAEALAALGASLSRLDGGGSELEAGSEVVVALPTGSLVGDPVAGAYRASYELEGQTHTVWLPSAAALYQRLGLLTDYGLEGVVLNHVAGSEMAGELVQAVGSFVDSAAAPAAQPVSLAWSVHSASGGELSRAVSDLANPQFAWYAVSTPGTYVISSQLAIGDRVADLGAIEIAVAAAPTATPTPAPTPTLTPTPAEVASTGPQYDPGDADAVVSGDLVNVREGPDTAFKQIARLTGGTHLEILAVNPANTWLRVQASDGTEGWVYAQLCTVYISLADRPVEDVPTPTPGPGGAAPPPVSGAGAAGGFELGGQVNGYASRPDVMQQARMTWVKLQAHHGQDASGMISGAHGQGFRILLSVIGDKSKVMNDGYQQGYAAYVGQLAAQGADAIEIWNEANLDREWPRDQIDPAAYTRLLAYSFNAIKASNPGTIVVGGAPAPTGAEGAFPGQVMNDNTWLQGVVNSGGLSYMDCVGIHYNEGTVGPNAWSGATQGDNYYTRYYGGMVNTYWSITGGARPLCFTELGYLTPEGYGALPGNFGWAASTTVAQQAQWLGEAVSLARSSGQVRFMIVFNVDFTQWLPTDPQAGYAIIRPGGGCPACATMGAAMGG